MIKLQSFNHSVSSFCLNTFILEPDGLVLIWSNTNVYALQTSWTEIFVFNQTKSKVQYYKVIFFLYSSHSRLYIHGFLYT